MKKIILFLIAMISFSMNAQDFEESWTKVYEFEYAGKIKLASEEVNKIYKKARKKNDRPEIIRTFIYQSKFSQTLEEEAQFKIIENLKKEINTKDVTTKAIFHYLYATFLSQYYEQFRYRLREKTATDTIYNPDFRTWSYATFDHEIANSFKKSLENEEVLLNTPLKNYEKIIEFNKYETELNLSLYDFLVTKYLEKTEYSTGIYEEGHTYLKDSIEDLFGDTNAFQKLNFSNLIKNNFYKKLSLYQKLEKNYASKNNILALSHTILKRITAVSETRLGQQEFITALKNISKTADERYKNAYLLKLATVYKNNASKNENIDYNQKALAIFDEIISKKQEPFTSEAKELKKNILQKNINVTTEKYLIPNQKNRALIYYTNVDTIYGSIYRVPNNFDFDNEYGRYNSRAKNNNRDSLYIDFANRHKPYKSFESILPNKSDNFNYSTEIIFPEIERGTYLLILNIKKEALSKESIYASNIINATELIVSTTFLDEALELQVLNRKTGKPIENAILKSDDFLIETKNDGKAIILNNIGNSNKIQVTYQKDTLSLDYSFNNYRGYENDNSLKFKAKVNFFTDRSIYRPGQTVYFKGILTQIKEEKTSIVPNLFVNVIVKNANDQEIFKSRLKSNEFGSFIGEFVIPKNSITGSFNIIAEEDDDYKNDEFYDKEKEEHPFWNNLENFPNSKLYFQVEEYKRPKFEIAFKPIKENFIVNQNIKIKGSANAFAGSKISDAKVSYTVTRNSYYNDWHYLRSYNNYDNTPIKTGETKTDENGNFEIDFTALPAKDFDEKGLPIFNYKITAEITDINGETRSKSTEAKVGYHSLELTAAISRNIDAGTAEEIKINSQNLNGQFVATQGEIKIYKLKSPNRILRNRSWSAPEIQTISEKEFEKIFPAEPYDEEGDLDKWENGLLVFSKKVNTETIKKVLLADLKKWTSGEYKLFFNAKDTFGKDIEAVSNFNLSNKHDKKLADNQLFQFDIINDDPKKDGFIELQFSSASSQLYILADAFYQSNTIFNKVVDLKDGKKSIKIPIDKRAKGEVKINMSFIWENQQFQKTTTVYLKETKESINIETISMRNKIEPGSSETWSFSIKDHNKKDLATEALATMYDASLDEFAKATWKTNLDFDTSYYNYAQKRNFLGFKNSYFSFNNLEQDFYEDYSVPTEFNWFGFDFMSQNYENSKYRRFLIDELAIKRGGIVSGFVTEKGVPLPGVRVVVSGTQRATVTDFDGYYEIKALLGEILEFNFIGMKEHFGFVNGDAINVNMNSDPSSLEEVVVTAYQTKKRSDIVGSVMILDDTASEIQLESKTITEALQGVAGITIENNTGQPGSSPTIRIRGPQSQNLNEDIFIIIDGIEFNGNLNSINLDDISEYKILKDSEAVSLYGSRGKNGVIVITTKKAIETLSKVKTRTNLSETAFFFPQLQTDAKGNLKFNFTSPEALTKWKLRILAHNKKATTGYLESSIITQKDLMILPNMPRFLREKDTIVVTSKITNITPEAKTGIAMLQLFDAVTMEAIDAKMLNASNTKDFSIKPNGNTTVSWKIYVPKGLQGVQYRILAKAGNFSDGEENILPILTNDILITESIPLWIRGNTKKEYTFENLKNNQSGTLKNHLLTLEYTSNPAWYAIKSLPYLMEYEHECAEQTFAKYYANTLANEIITSNPKIAEVFEIWKKSGKSLSKIEENEELKSIILAETPWLRNSQSDEEQKKNLALLFDLEKMKANINDNFEKLDKKQSQNGGFSWFSGGSENQYITRHIVAGLGHLEKLKISNQNIAKFKRITEKAVPFIDSKFLEHDKEIEIYSKKHQSWNYDSYSDLHYLYARSFYIDQNLMSDTLKKVIKKHLDYAKTNWQQFDLYKKGMLALVLNRFNEKQTAKNILESLRQTAVTNEENGMYWIDNKSGWYWYHAPIETQALLIEAFTEIANDKKSVEAMKVWLLKNRETQSWKTTKATTEAVYALLLQGENWLSIKDNTFIKLGDEKIMTKKLSENEKEAGTGYIKLNWKADEISKDMATISINNKSEAPGFGGYYWQYFEDIDKVKSSQESTMTIEKELYLKANSSEGKQLQRITDAKPLKIGDLVTVRLIIYTQEDMEFVHLKDMRASCFEPIDIISGYKWQDGLGYYQSTKDVATHFFFDTISKGKYVLEYDIRVNNLGDFSNGITTIQSMYAPEFSSHSKGIRVKIKE